jgi:hypothetical protein
VKAVRLGDASAVFDALLLPTQWSLHTVAKSQREMRRLIERSYPERERAAALQRLLPSAADGRALFEILYPVRYKKDFQRRLGSGPITVTPAGSGAGAACVRAGGQPFRFAPDKKGRFGMSELDKEWELLAVRAVHDLATVRENARLYEGAR